MVKLTATYTFQGFDPTELELLRVRCGSVRIFWFSDDTIK